MSIFRSFIICPIFIRIVFDGVGIFTVQFQFQRVEADVFPDTGQFGFVPDDVFVVVSLPDGGARGFADAVDTSCGDRFKIADDGP